MLVSSKQNKILIRNDAYTTTMDEYKRAIDAPSRDEANPEDIDTEFEYNGTFPDSLSDVVTEGDTITIRTEMLETYQALTIENISNEGEVTFEPIEERPIVEMLSLRVEPVDSEEVSTIEELEEERYAQLEEQFDSDDAKITVDYEEWQVWNKIQEGTVLLEIDSPLKEDAMPVFTLINQTTQDYYGSPDQILLSAF